MGNLEGSVDDNKLALEDVDGESRYNCEYKCIDGNKDVTKMISNSAVIEFIDTDESNCSMIMNTPDEIDNDLRYTHCEIHPSLLLGAVGFTIPFSNRSQAIKKRLWYWSDQTICRIIRFTFRNRMDGTGLFYTANPQKPLISTRLFTYRRRRITWN